MQLRQRERGKEGWCDEIDMLRQLAVRQMVLGYGGRGSSAAVLVPYTARYRAGTPVRYVARLYIYIPACLIIIMCVFYVLSKVMYYEYTSTVNCYCTVR